MPDEIVPHQTPSKKQKSKVHFTGWRIMSESQCQREFRSPEEVIAFFREQVENNGTPSLAGVEEEIVVVNSSGKPVSHQRFQTFLGDLIQSLPEGVIIPGKSVYGGEIPVLKGRFAFGSVQPETNTTLVELAHAPRETAWGIFEQSRLFTAQLKKSAQKHDMAVIGIGAVPTVSWDDFLENDVVIPNADYSYSWGHMTQGTRPEYCRTVFGTASIHHNMGFNDPDRMAKYITTVLRMQPTMIALLGNSPIWNNKVARVEESSLLSYRSRVQIDYGKIFGKTNAVDYLYPDFLVDSASTFASIIEGYLDLPLDRTIIGGRKASCNGLTMREYLKGHEIDGVKYYPNEDALMMMVREPIVDVRPCFSGSAPRVETRAHDCVSQHVAVAVDAFYRGILANLDAAAGLMFQFTKEQIRTTRQAVCETGLATPVEGLGNLGIATQANVAQKLLEISEQGLALRGHNEEALLAPLWVLAETGLNPGQRLLAQRDQFQNDVHKMLDAIDYSRSSFADGTCYIWPSRVATGSNPARTARCSL